MANDRELDQWRVGEALRRGWIRQTEVDPCLEQLAPEGSLLAALARRGVLSKEQLMELELVACAMGPGETFSVGELIQQRYRVQKLLSSRAGQVYICVDTVNGTRCALKTPRLLQPGSAQTLEMLRNEILVWIGLGDHPNIVLAFGLEEVMGQPFVVMEVVEGGSLAERVAQGPLGWQKAASFGWQIANGMEYAGQVCSLVHHDLKPANILVTRDGVAKVTDFGIALLRGAQDEAPAGTPHYMAPELWSKLSEVDVRSDVYSYGVTLYELATGQLPFEMGADTSLEQIGQMHLNEVPQDPRRLEPRMPEPMARLIMRCLEKRQKDRPENFGVIRRALEPLAGPQRQTLSFAPSRVGGLVNQTSTYQRMGRQDDAERAARNAVQLDARSVKARIALANALAERKAYPQALGHLEEAYRLAPAEPAAILNSALYANLAGDQSCALRWLQTALDAVPLRQLECLTPMMIDLGRVEQAIEICERIVAEDDTAIVAWNSLSIARRRSGQLEQALACADRTVQLNPRYARGWSNRATILVQMGLCRDAVAAADRALQFDASTAGAYAAKAAALGQLGRPSEGRECLQIGLKRLPGNALLERALQQFEQLT